MSKPSKGFITNMKIFFVVKTIKSWSILFLAILGVLVSSYLSWTKLTDNELSCQGVGNCNLVNSSVYSSIFDIPIAYLGVTMYMVIVILNLLETRVWFDSAVKLSVFGISLFGFIYSAWLTYVELAIIKAICIYCVASAVIISTIFLISIFQIKDFFLTD